MDKFTIPGSPSDYYVAIQNVHGVTEYKATRSKIRELVELHNSRTKEIIADGGNPHTAYLDMHDVIAEFVGKEPQEAQIAFYNVFNQEMEAATSAVIERTNKINEEAAKKELNNVQIGQWLGALVIFLIVLAFLMH